MSSGNSKGEEASPHKAFLGRSKDEENDLQEVLTDRQIDDVVKMALAEDLGDAGDITSQSVIAEGTRCTGIIVSREAGTIAGLPVVRRVFDLVDAALTFKTLVGEGAHLQPDQTIAEIEGSARSILAAERTALNFLQHLSGIATLAYKFHKAVGDMPVNILDTRKTIPGLRSLEKYAIRVGGGQNHRFGLFDGILIKDNHLRLAGSIEQAVSSARRRFPGEAIEVETENLTQVKEAIEAGADVIMLDNMALGQIEEAVKLVGGRAIIEVSGGVNLERIGQIARTGVDRISAGVLTQGAPPLDLSLEIVERG